MNAVELTVLLASRNGEAVLPRTLEGYRRAQPPPVAWKMVIADNGSTDSTREIIDAFSRDLPIELVQQSIPGKNAALNAAVPLVEGRLVVVTDDDAIPHPSFLAAWSQLLDSRQDCELFGGSIEPLFDSPPPKWMLGMKGYFAFMFSERDLPEGPMDPGDIYGPNMAVRASVFDRGFRFDENLGPNGLDPSYPMGSETEFCRRVGSLGAKSWFASKPRVYHIVRPIQLKSSAWAERAYRTGRGRAHQMFQRGEILGVPTPSLIDRLAMLSPMAGHRLRGLCAHHLARGFRDECTRRLRS
jgi:GT2 family glycosyltransferase